MLCLKNVFFASTALGFSVSAFADISANLQTVVSSMQASHVVNSIQVSAGAPSGTKVNNVLVSGDFTVNDSHQLVAFKIDSLNFTVIVPVLFFTLTDNVHVQLSAEIPDGDCTKPTNIIITESGTNSIVDGKIRDYINSHSNDLVTNQLIKLTSLVNYCAVKPTADLPSPVQDVQIPVIFY